MMDLTSKSYRWRQDCRPIPCTLGECWGPAEADIMAAAALEVTSPVDFTAYDSHHDDVSSSEGEDGRWEDQELYEQMETMALRDAYTTQGPSDVERYSSDDDSTSIEMPLAKKRKRRTILT